MGSCSSVSKGGSSSGSAKIEPTALEIVRENSSQFNLVLQEAKRRNVAKVEYEDAFGRTIRRYFDGATYSDRKSTMAEKFTSAKGVYKAKFKKPENWK